MAIFNFFCQHCQKKRKVFADTRPTKAICRECKREVSPDDPGGKISSRVVEHLDTGIQARIVERLTNFNELKDDIRSRDEKTDDII